MAMMWPMPETRLSIWHSHRSHAPKPRILADSP